MSKIADTTNPADMIVTMDRRREDRRAEDSDAATAEAKPTRRKAQRRRQIDPTTCERDYSNDEIEFMRAMDEYKRAAGRMFPTCSEILEVIRNLGYVRLSEDQRALLGDGLVESSPSATSSWDTDEDEADLDDLDA